MLLVALLNIIAGKIMKKIHHAAAYLIILVSLNGQCLLASDIEINRRSLKIYLSQLGIEQKQLPVCQFQEENLCQNKGSGGHSATIFSTRGGYCAKKIHSRYTVKEIEFYLTAQDYCKSKNRRESICSFLPEYAGLCKHKKQVYLQMENLKDFSQNNRINSGYNADAWALDMKLGSKTASLHSMKRSKTDLLQRFFWISLHYFQDQHFTSSENLGFRFAGLSSSDGNVVTDKGFFAKTSYFKNPRKVIDKFLDEGQHTMITECFSNKLKKLHLAFQDEDIWRFQLIGSSLLFVYDHNQISVDKSSCRLHMIDFANSFLIQKDEEKVFKSNMKHVLGYKRGIENLLVEFSDYYLIREQERSLSH